MGDYKVSVSLYNDLFTKASNAAGEDELLADILTNMLACASNQDAEAIAHVGKLVEKTSGQLERTYEFFFNLS